MTKKNKTVPCKRNLKCGLAEVDGVDKLRYTVVKLEQERTKA